MTLPEYYQATRREAQKCAEFAEQVRARWHKSARISFYSCIFFSVMLAPCGYLDQPLWVAGMDFFMAAINLALGLHEKRRGDRDYREFMIFREAYLNCYPSTVEAIAELEKMLRERDAHTEGEEWKAEE